MVKADRNSRAWDMGTSTSSRSFELESWSYIQHKDYQLHLLQKTEKLTVIRPPIPSTESERLAYYRCYTAAPYKIQITYMQPFDISRFIWIYIWNLLFHTFSMNYLHVFLAAYSPDEHQFSSKMIPLFIGVSWQIVICGILQLLMSADVLSLLMHYTIYGFLFKNPWTRCSQRIFSKLWPFPYDTECIFVLEYMNFTQYYTFGIRGSNSTTRFFFNSNYYFRLDNKPNPWFQIAPINYFLRQTVKTSVLQYRAYEWIAYYVVIWIVSGLLYKMLFRRHIWKILKICHFCLTFLYLFAAMIVFIAIIEEEDEEHAGTLKTVQMDRAAGWDYDILAQSISGPPVVQLLTARSTDRHIDPGRDSCVIVVSNAVFYLFTSFVNHKIKHYVEDLVEGPVLASWYNPYPILTYWAIFFDKVFMGSLMVRLFYLVTMIVEFCIFAITYQIILEVIVCEWRFTKRWIATILLSSIGLTLSTVLKCEDKRYLYVFTTSITTLTEMVVVCWLYPLTRLIDDMYFQFGVPPSYLRKWSFRIMPIYAAYKLYSMSITFYDTLNAGPNLRKEDHSIAGDYTMVSWAWTASVVPVLLGVFYSMIKYMIVQKQSWRILFKPRPDWGPRDHVTRQLRKQFDSKNYVGSQASRYLSRHLLTKAETPSYRLDIRYDISPGGGAARRSTVFTEGFRFEADRKNL